MTTPRVSRAEYGWEFGARTAGHLIGHFPHETLARRILTP